MAGLPVARADDVADALHEVAAVGAAEGHDQVPVQGRRITLLAADSTGSSRTARAAAFTPFGTDGEGAGSYHGAPRHGPHFPRSPTGRPVDPDIRRARTLPGAIYGAGDWFDRQRECLARTWLGTCHPWLANTRCDQERLIGQLKSGVNSLRSPVDNLFSNWAYMVIATLAWNFTKWFALLLPESGRWEHKHADERHTVLRMNFRTFVSAFMLVPTQLVRTGRRVVLRLLAWNPWQHVFFRALDAVRTLS